MKIECIKIFNNRGEELETSSWLTIGKEYIVLEVLCHMDKGYSYRIVSDDSSSSPGVFKATQFRIVNSKQPSNWVTSIKNNGLIVVGPKSWRVSGFWEDCYDQDPKALEIYKREAKIIYEEEDVF